MKTDLLILLLLGAACLCSCSYDPEPPKTGGNSVNYVLPKGEVPTSEDLSELAAIREAYQEGIR
ncbi:MAG: NUDIX hydrolase [Bacteroidales bacterium]|nr:NUDIX hydrolase [Bacteroidales bacterium]